jgi:alpha-tubulin suppressor-like RCC1 family protein
MKFILQHDKAVPMNLSQKLNELFEYDGKTSEKHLEWLSRWNLLIIRYGALLYNERETTDEHFLAKCKSIKDENKSLWTKEIARVFGPLLKIMKKLKDLSLAFKVQDRPKPPRSLYELGMLERTDRFHNGIFTNLKVSHVSCGSMHVVVLSQGKVYSMGNNSFGRLGRSGATTELLEVDFATEPCQAQEWRTPFEGGLFVSAGYSHNFVIDLNHDIWGWGCTDSGRLGVCELDVINWRREICAPVRIKCGDVKFDSVSAGSVHSVAVSTDHKLYTWGNGAYSGQPPVLSPSGKQCLLDTWSPTLLKVLRDINIRQAECRIGGYHTLVLSYRGSIWSFGHNRVGQCGYEAQPWDDTWLFEDTRTHNSVDRSSRKTLLSRSGDWRFVEEDFVELPRFIEPVKCVSSIGYLMVAKIRAGWGHSLFLDVKGRLFACGRNTSGQVGLLPADCSRNSRWHPYLPTPTIVPLLQGIEDMDMTSESSFAVDRSGHIFSWGCNSAGGMSGLLEEQDYTVFDGGTAQTTIMCPLLLGRETIEVYDHLPRRTSNSGGENWSPQTSSKISLVGGTTKMYILF